MRRLDLQCCHQIILMKKQPLTEGKYIPLVPLLADGGDWVLVMSSFHFIMSHHTYTWALSLHVCYRAHISSCGDSMLTEVIAIASRKKKKMCLLLHDNSDSRKLTLSACSPLSIKHSLLKSLAIIRDDIVTNVLSQQMDRYEPLTNQ